MVNQTVATVEKPSIGAERPMDISTKLGYERTNLAHERTMMAWVRTATALISFGFTIYKFFELEKASLLGVHHQVIGPHKFAIIMIAIGILSLVMATIEHRQHIMSMRKEHIKIPRSLASWVAGLISALGLLAMAAVIFRL
jgi:putative membrane protein